MSSYRRKLFYKNKPYSGNYKRSAGKSYFNKRNYYRSRSRNSNTNRLSDYRSKRNNNMFNMYSKYEHLSSSSSPSSA